MIPLKVDPCSMLFYKFVFSYAFLLVLKGFRRYKTILFKYHVCLLFSLSSARSL